MYQFKRMPFGLSSAPSAFQKVMVTVVAGVPGVAIYMDDIVVHGPDRPTHDQRLNKVFQRLHHHNLTVNVEKCTFAVSEVPFVGHRISVGEREALTCIWACEKWHIFLFGRRFLLRTDHQALTSLLSASGTGQRSLRLHRWMERLCRYTFRVEYRPGRCNQVADLLSRSPAPIEEPVQEAEDSGECVLLLNTWSPGISLEQMEKESGADTELQRVLDCTREGWSDPGEL